MNAIDIGLFSYGRLKFLQECIDSIVNTVKTPHSLYVANCFCPEEPEIEDYLLELFKQRVLDGLILIKGNIYSCGLDLLYKHFLKSNPFVMSDADIVLPKVSYCPLEYMVNAVQSDSTMAFVTMRPSMCNIGNTDEDVKRRIMYVDKATILKQYNNYEVHKTFSRIGVGLLTGLFFQVFNRCFYDRYLKRYERLGHDCRLRTYARRRKMKWGALLDDCLHLGWQVEEVYPQYVQHKVNIIQNDLSAYLRRWEISYPGVRYQIFGRNDLSYEGVTL